MRILCLDIGEKRIGLAISDESGKIAFGLDVLRRQNLEKDLDNIEEVAIKHGAQKIILGMPVNMNGTLGAQAQMVEEFKQELEKKSDIPVCLQDERLSTVSAENVLIEGNISRKKRRSITDKLAAQIILQSYLDSEVQK